MIAVIVFTVINLIWIALASYLVVRLPRCKSIPPVGKMFIILLLILQIVNSLFLLQEIIAKENIMRDVKSKTKVDSNKSTLDNLNRLLMTDFWHQILTLLIIIVLYYVIFKTIYTCEHTVIPSNIVWVFLVITVLKYGMVSVVKPSVDNKIMLQAIAN